MAVTVEGSGSQAATVNTDHTLQDVATAGTRQFNVDLTPMQAGDAVELRVRKIFKTGGSKIVVYKETYYGVQDPDDAGKVSVPISNALTDAGSLRFSLKQTQGSSRTFDWEVLKF